MPLTAPCEEIGDAEILAGLGRPAGGLSVMAGELVRCWGQDRDFFTMVDDFLVGVPLVTTAILMKNPPALRHCAFSAAFAAAAGLLYGSFASTLLDPSQPVHSDIAPDLLTALIGRAFVAACAGLAASLYLVHQASRGDPPDSTLPPD